MAEVTLAFDKYEGTANDFVVLEVARDAPVLDDAAVARLCDRHRGIGADGLMLVSPGANGAHARLVVRNADGSRPEMCGNGLRCVALHVHVSRGEGVREILVDTDAGRRLCVVEPDGPHAAQVTVDMGLVTVGERLEVPCGALHVALQRADAGNPHAVTFEPLDDEALDALGTSLQRGGLFANGVNLERARVRRDGERVTIDVAVFERGVGRTLACGTGACAVAAVAIARGFAETNQPIGVVLAGGSLEVVVDDTGHASMRGPVRHVFSGALVPPSALFRAVEPRA